MTGHVFRLLMVVPVNRVAAVAGWLAANIDPETDLNIGPRLNATGLAADPVTHRIACGAFTDVEAKAILLRICQLASVTPPTAPQWTGWTKAEKIAWLVSVRNALVAGFGVWLGLMGNEDSWDDVDGILANLNLKPVREAVG